MSLVILLMNGLVHVKDPGLGEPFMTHPTLEGLLPGVSPHVHGQALLLGEPGPALQTIEWPQTHVTPLVPPQIASGGYRIPELEVTQKKVSQP